MDKYQNKYRIQSTRFQGYDYARAGLYFITVCTKNREYYFGEIIDNEMKLSNIGVLADTFWFEIKQHSKNIELHQFVVMPNHIHGILEIVDNGGVGSDGRNDGSGGGRGDACIASTIITATTTTIKSQPKSSQPINKKMAAISPKSGSISRVIGSYKSAVSKHAHRLGYEFEWQSRFHDHIIRNKNEYFRISNYIENNPKKWKDDKFN